MCVCTRSVHVAYRVCTFVTITVCRRSFSIPMCRVCRNIETKARHVQTSWKSKQSHLCITGGINTTGGGYIIACSGFELWSSEREQFRKLCAANGLVHTKTDIDSSGTLLLHVRKKCKSSAYFYILCIVLVWVLFICAYLFKDLRP